ncbi:sialate O-acetylesterase [Lentisphaera profundi]|uniref:Sialate O-acetylesterase n=1 Tax=Lentisphaera profundi TaxID=1658616 RepID=A0ABY7VVT8_9BACT|nr:sialate O-acetylesterase [Lentisphaera profundi]WDE98343.1 sialate O-acetylesterase [Lentisphaera profundi]
MNKLIYVILVVSFCSLQADIKLPKIFNNKMVIQRNANAPIWGTASPGEKIKISTSWGSGASTIAGKDGKWMIRLKTPKAGGPHNISFKGDNSVQLNNVLSGDVWLCSGQSNMEWTLANCTNAQQESQAAHFPEIRHFKAQHKFSKKMQSDNHGDWKICTPENVKHFSAVAYFFAREIYQDQKVPIGILSINWGGTRIEPWINPTGFHSVPELKALALKVDSVNPQTISGNKAYKQYVTEMKAWITNADKSLAENAALAVTPQEPTLGHSHQDPTYLYNAMINPIVPLSIKGAIWYQGESNGGEGSSYMHKMLALIKGWRKAFENEQLPFYYVQLANLGNSNPNDPNGGDGWAPLRQAQLDTLKLNNTGMAVTVDIGEAKDIHPRNKQDVGKRLAYWALAKDYGKKDLIYSGPIFKEMTVDGNKAIVSFDSVGSGLMLASKKGLALPVQNSDKSVSWASIKGADNKWHKADAVIIGNTVVFSHKNVKQAKGVRYAYYMNPQGMNLYNKEGLPASPFSFELK